MTSAGGTGPVQDPFRRAVVRSAVRRGGPPPWLALLLAAAAALAAGGMALTLGGAGRDDGVRTVAAVGSTAAPATPAGSLPAASASPVAPPLAPTQPASVLAAPTPAPPTPPPTIRLGAPPASFSPPTAAPARTAGPTPAATPRPSPTIVGALITDGWGGMHTAGNASVDGSGAPWWGPPQWQNGWDISRAVVLRSQGGGWELDGWGGVHSFGGAPTVDAGDYRSGTDWARGLQVTHDGRGYWVMDGMGTIEAFGDAHPVTMPHGSWSWDIARALLLHFSTVDQPDGGWILDGWGAIHAFGNAPSFTTPSTLYRPNDDYMRGFAVAPDGHGYYLLDAYGTLYPENGAPGIAGTPSWSGKTARGLAIQVR